MNLYDIVRIVSRILAIYVVIRIIDMLQIMIPPIMQMKDAIKYFPFASILLYIMLFLLLWYRSDWIARVIVKDPDAVFQKGKITAIQLHSVLFSVVGVFILANVIPQLIQIFLASTMDDANYASIYGAMLDFGIKDIAPTRSMMPQFIGLGLKLIIGLWLLFGAKGLVGLLNRERKEE